MKESRNDQRPAEQQAVRTTIVGGHPPGSGKGIGEIPRGIEVLVKKASVDAEFRKALLAARSGAAKLIDLALEPAEAAILDVVPAAQLEAIVARTKVSAASRAAFLGRAAVLMLAALGASVRPARGAEVETFGNQPDRVPEAVREIQDRWGNEPPAVEQPPPVLKLKPGGIRPDVIDRQTAPVIGLLTVLKDDKGTVTAVKVVSKGGRLVCGVVLDDIGKKLAELGNGAKVNISATMLNEGEEEMIRYMTVKVTAFEKKTIPLGQNVQLTGKTTVTKDDKDVVTALQLLAFDEEIGGTLPYNVALDAAKGKEFLEFAGKNSDAEFKVVGSVAEKDNVRTLTVTGFALKPVPPKDLPEWGIRPQPPLRGGVRP